MENKVLLGKKIKSKRLSLDLTMDYVSNKAEITRSTLWSMENGNGNYSIDSLLRVLDVLSIELDVKSINLGRFKRIRASRTNSALDKKINRFIIMCVEQYASANNKDSKSVYEILEQRGIIEELISGYEDYHGMSTTYLNDSISSLLKGANL